MRKEKRRGGEFVFLFFKYKISDENLGLSSENSSHFILHWFQIPQQENINRT